MEYVDRYRIALERAAKLTSASKKRSVNALDAPQTESERVATTVDSSTPSTAAPGAATGLDEDSGNGDNDDDDSSALPLHAVLLQTRKRKQQSKKQRVETIDDDDDEAFDPCNWRAKAF